MKISYYPDTDTLSIDFRDAEAAETRDLDASTLIDLDKDGQLCSMTIDNATKRAGMPHFSFEQVVA